MTNSLKPIKVLVMSVGASEKNGTLKYLKRIGAPAESIVICLPKQYEENAKTYNEKDCDVFIYDQDKYINDDFEFFGFKKRNCGGVGRQGIAEAVDKYGDDYICFQVDDDTAQFVVGKRMPDGKLVRKSITKWENFQKMVNALSDFYDETGIELAGAVAAAPPSDGFINSHKIFNNFVMHKGNRLNYDGFRALCSDDVRFNVLNNFYNHHPMIACTNFFISFRQNQGDRNDGNAVIYNGDYSWKKSFATRLMFPWGCKQLISSESNRKLFREFLVAKNLYPRILVTDNGKVVGEVKW